MTYANKLGSSMSSKNHQKDRYLSKRIANESSKVAFKRRVPETSWEGLGNPNESWIKFVETITQIHDCFSKTKLKIKSNKKANQKVTKGIAKQNYASNKQKLYETIPATFKMGKSKGLYVTF